MSIQNIYRLITVTLVLLYANGICAQNSNYSELLETIGIFYYSPFYHEEQLVRRSVKLDGFIDDVPIKVLIHGYIASRYHSSIEPIKEAYLSAGNTVSVTVSVLTLTFISIDRWYAICFPLRYVSTNGRAWCSVGVIWIAALVSDLPEFINSRTKKTELRFNIDLFTQCVSTWDKNTEKNVVIARFVLLYLAPLFFMSIAYFKIIRVLWKSDTIPGHRESCNHRQMHTVHSRNTVANSSTLSQLRARRKAAKMLVVVVLMFAICYLPVHTLNIVRYTIEQEQTTIVAILSLISHWLCYANSAVNPLIYNFMSGKFRREFVSALERCRCSNRDVYRHHSCYFNPTGGRLNTISPNTRSLCQFSSHRDRNKSFREKHTIQTSFVENVCDIYPDSVSDGRTFGITTNGTSVPKTTPNGDRQHSPSD